MRRLLNTLSAALLACVLLATTTSSAGAAESSISIFGGAFAAGRLFTAVSETDRNWVTPDGRNFRGIEVRAEVEETFVAGMRFQKAMGPQWGLTASFSGADANISVLSRTVQANVDKRDWDQAFILSGEFTAFYDLVESGNTAFVFGGAGLSLWSGVGNSGLDQTSPSLVVGAGYRIRGIGFDIDLEARDAIVFSNFDDERDRLQVSDADFDGNPPTQLWSFTAAWVYAF